MPLSRPERNKFLVVSGLLVFQLILISVQVPLGEAPTMAERALFFVLSPLQRVSQSALGGIAKAWNRYLYLRDVEIQNQALRDDLFRFRQENLRLQNGFLEMRDRETAVRLLSGLRTSFLLASTIGVDAMNVHKSVVINKGRSDGLTTNMAVVDGEGRLVGRTIEPISPHEATVELLTNDNCSFGVVSQKSKVVAILSGDGRTGQCRLKYILASNDSLEVGEELLTSGFDRIFPAGIPAGRVVSIKKESSSFKTILVRPYLEISNLHLVAVLTGTPEKRP